jgi:hypothetical protein
MGTEKPMKRGSTQTLPTLWELAEAETIAGYCTMCGEAVSHSQGITHLCPSCVKQDNQLFWFMWRGDRIPSLEEQAIREVRKHCFDWRTGERYTDRQLLRFAVSDIPGYLCWHFPSRELKCLHFRTLWQKVSRDGEVYYETGAVAFGSRAGIVEYLLLEPLSEGMQQWFENEVQAKRLHWFEEGAWEGQGEKEQES